MLHDDPLVMKQYASLVMSIFAKPEEINLHIQCMAIPLFDALVFLF